MKIQSRYFYLIFLTLALFEKIEANHEFSKLKIFFESLLCEHDFAYVLFGSKPMALADICLEMPNTPPHQYFKVHFRMLETRRHLDNWYKYRKALIQKDYILLDNEQDLCNCTIIVLINKPNMLPVLEENKQYFKQVIGNSFEPLAFLDKLERKEMTLAEAIHHHYGLLGILLGYGAKNSMLFQERMQTLHEMEQKKWFLVNVNDLEKKYTGLNAQFQDFSTFEDFPLVRPLYFGADLKSDETKFLKMKYLADRIKIAEYMQKPNFAELAFNKLFIAE